MLVAKLTNGVILLGLDAENIRRLCAGQPILKSLAQFGGTDDVAIVYGETLDALEKDLERVFGPLPDAQPNPHLDG